jgi:hypothetical protein
LSTTRILFVENRRGPLARLAVWGCLWLVLSRGAAAVGQEPESPEPTAGGQADSSPETGPANPRQQPADRDAARQRAYSLGVVMIGGILILGVGLVALVLLWGNRMRRIARQPLPKVAPRDELWYLKSKKEPAAESEPEDEEEPLS